MYKWKGILEAVEIARHLKVHDVLSEDLSWVSSTQTHTLNGKIEINIRKGIMIKFCKKSLLLFAKFLN